MMPFAQGGRESAGPAARPLDGMPPPEPGEPGEVAVRRHQIATRLDGQGGQPGVGYQVAPGVRFPAQVREDTPVAGSRRHGNTVALASKDIRCADGSLKRGRRVENHAVGYNTDKSAEHEIRHGEGLVTLHEFSQPFTVFGVIYGILAVGVDEDINVRKVHGPP